MKYKSGDKVKVINPTFAKTWENMGRKNEWEIDFIETRTKGHPSLYICYCVDDTKLIKNQAMVEVSASDTYGKNVKRKKKKYLTI